MAERFRGTPDRRFENGFDLTLRPHKLSEPLGWRRPRRIFVHSMSDLFHEPVPRPESGSVVWRPPIPKHEQKRTRFDGFCI